MALSLLLEMAADTWPDRQAVGTANSGLTAGDLAAVTAGGAVYLGGTGVGSVAYLDANGPEFVVALWSAARSGLPFCPLNYRLSDEQLVSLIRTLDTPLVIAARAHRPLVERAGARFVDTDEFMTGARDAMAGADLPSVDDASTAVLLFTSGTTSTPKAVVLSHANLVSYVLETVEFAGARPDDAILVCMPPYHVAGVNGALTNVYTGRRLVHLPNFDAAEWLETVKVERITHAMVVPTMLARIVELLADRRADVPSLRHLAYGGAKMPRPVLEKALALFPGVDFVNAYGLTETSSTIAVLGPDDHRSAAAAFDEASRDRLGSVGQVVPGVEAEIRDDTGATVPPGVVGELFLRGRQISGSYLGRGSSLDEAGWFATRDRARLDGDGYLYIEGRADDTIIRGGENIAPAEIEDVVVEHPLVADVAVVGVPDEEWGERIVAAIVPRAGERLSEQDVRDFVRARLRGSRTPDDVVFVEALPYNATGKLVRRELAAIAGELLAIAASAQPSGR